MSAFGRLLNRLMGRRAPAEPTGKREEYVYRGAYTALGYQVIRTAVRDGNLATSSSGKQHEKIDRHRLIDLSREFYRDDPFYKGIVTHMADYTVGNGFNLQCKSSDDEWNKLVERWWRNQFWDKPEIKQNLSGSGVERMVASELFRCGDVGAVKTQFGKLQLVEAEQIRGPGLMDDGIRRGEFGEPVEFMVAPWGENGMVNVAAARPYSPHQFLFVSAPDRPSSSRGVPPLSAAFSMFRRIADVFDSEALARQLQARLAVSITKKGGPNWGAMASKADPNKVNAEGDPAKRVFTWDAGLIMTGQPGEKIESIARSAPGPEFEKELVPFLRFVGAALGIPLEFVYMDWTRTNYSQARAILEQAQITFTFWQEAVVKFFHKPAFEWAVDRAMSIGELPIPRKDDYLAHEWIMPAWPWIDQLKEAQAAGEQLDRGLTTHAQVLKGRRMDRGEFLEQRKRETEEAIQASQEIEKKYGVKVPYQIFMGQKAEPQGSAPAAPQSIPAEEQPADEATTEKEAA